MSEKFYQSKQFKDLKKKWYKKLQKEGFEDIEWHDAETGDGENSSYLKSNFIQTYLSDRLSSKQTLGNSFRYEIQRSLDHFTEHGKFSSPLLKQVWTMYAEGKTYREMSNELRKLYKKKKAYSVFWVFSRVKELRLEMIKFNNNDPNGLKLADSINELELDYEEFDHEINGEDYEYERQSD